MPASLSHIGPVGNSARGGREEKLEAWIPQFPSQELEWRVPSFRVTGGMGNDDPNEHLCPTWAVLWEICLSALEIKCVDIFICLTSFRFEVMKSWVSGSRPDVDELIPYRQSSYHLAPRCFWGCEETMTTSPGTLFLESCATHCRSKEPWVSLYAWRERKDTLLQRAGVQAEPTRNPLASTVALLSHIHIMRQQKA